MKHYSLLGLAPLTLYLGAFTVVPVVSTLVLSFRTPEGDWGLGAFHALAAHYQFGEAVVNSLIVRDALGGEQKPMTALSQRQQASRTRLGMWNFPC